MYLSQVKESERCSSDIASLPILWILIIITYLHCVLVNSSQSPEAFVSAVSGFEVLSRESGLRRGLVELCVLALRGATPVAIGVLIRNVWMNASPHHFHPRVWVKYGLFSWSLAETIFMLYIWLYTRFLNGQTTRRWRAVNVHNTAEKRKASMERAPMTRICRFIDMDIS